MPRIKCPGCGAVHAFSARCVGEVIRCTQCFARVRLPQVEGTAAFSGSFSPDMKAGLDATQPEARLDAIDAVRVGKCRVAAGALVARLVSEEIEGLGVAAFEAWRQVEDAWIVREFERAAPDGNLSETFLNYTRMEGPGQALFLDPSLLPFAVLFFDFYQDEPAVLARFLKTGGKSELFAKMRRQETLIRRLRAHLKEDPAPALWALAELRQAEDTALARDLLSHGFDPEVQEACVYYLTRSRDLVTTPFFLRWIEDLLGETCRALQGTSEVPEEVLPWTHPRFRRLLEFYKWGIIRLLHPGTPLCLVEFLKRRENPRVQEVALRALRRLGRTELMIPFIPDLFESNDADLLLEFLHLLEWQGNLNSYVDRLFRLLGFPDERVRRLAKELVLSHRAAFSNDAGAWIKLLEKPELPQAALMLLMGDLGIRQAAPRMAERLDDPLPEVRRAALKALVAIGASSQIPRIKDLLDDKEPELRKEALLAIAALNEGEYLDTLRKTAARELRQKEPTEAVLLQAAETWTQKPDLVRSEDSSRLLLLTNPKIRQAARRVQLSVRYGLPVSQPDPAKVLVLPSTPALCPLWLPYTLQFGLNERANLFLDVYWPLVGAEFIRYDFLQEEITIGFERDTHPATVEELDRLLSSERFWRDLYQISGRRPLRYVYRFAGKSLEETSQVFVRLDENGFFLERREFGVMSGASLYLKLTAASDSAEKALENLIALWSLLAASENEGEEKTLSFPPENLLPEDREDYLREFLLPELLRRITHEMETPPDWFASK